MFALTNKITNKYKKNMEITPTPSCISVRGAINALEVDGTLYLPKKKHKVSCVRSTASSITGDTGKSFTVSTDDDNITVTRNS